MGWQGGVAPGSSEPAGAGSPPRLAVLTMARDEGDLLRVWVDHYARQVGREHVVVVDDNSVDGSTADLGCTVHRLPPWQVRTRSRFDRVRLRILNGIAAGLLAVYDYVVLADADEFLVTDPRRHPTLADLLQARGRPRVLGAVGLNVVQVPAIEPAVLDLSKPILRQRGHAVLTPVMAKPAVKSIRARWTSSSHGIAAPYRVDPELFLLHLKFADRERLASVAAHRHALSKVDGRGARASWGQRAAAVLDVFDTAVGAVDPGAVRELDPSTADVDRLVVRDGGRFRAPAAGGQLGALSAGPIVRIPAGLRDAL